MTPRDTLSVIDHLYNNDDSFQLIPSPLETAYTKRAGEALRQFGYDQLRNKPQMAAKADKQAEDKPAAMPAGAVQDDFVLNSGDSLRITFRGQRQDSKLYAVTSQGQLLVDDLPPVTAAGRTIAQLRDDLQTQVSALPNTSLFISLESVRQINVLVVGHVAKPGRQTLTVFHTALDALTEAGGIDKTGSLRDIRLIRGGKSSTLDLYTLLVRGKAPAGLGLQDGDRLMIPPIGPTVAVAGGVKRPGIYEIRRDGGGVSEKLTLNAMLDLAGGPLLPGRNRFIRLDLTRGGEDAITDAQDSRLPAFTEGGILRVEAAAAARTGTVQLAGETRRPGLFAIDHAMNLSALFDTAESFGPHIYPLIGVVARKDREELAPQLVAFNPLRVLHRQDDLALAEGDVVHLFSRRQILYLDADPKATGRAVKSRAAAAVNPEDRVTDPVLVSFLRERCAYARGAVRQERCWPVADGATLANLLAAAGGLTEEASAGNIVVTSRLQGQGVQGNGRSGVQRLIVNERETDPAAIAIGPGDSVRVQQAFQRAADRSVLILGEIVNPGRYDLKADDHLSDLLAEAGGLTNEAYPQGAIFSRESERKAEELRFRAQAQELELGLAAALRGGRKANDRDEAIDQNRIGAAQGLIDELRGAEGVGRLTVEADPGALAARPEEDMLLETGDRIYIPRRPLTVRVAGEVLSPASLQFRKDKTGSDYLNEAGGLTYNADDGRAFVVFPDGSAAPLHVSSWNRSGDLIPPGSTIIVPRDPKPYDFLETAKDVSQILSNLAITGIFVHDIHNNGGD